MTATGHTNQAAERAFWKGPAMWRHACIADRSLLQIESGAPCNWCGATEPHPDTSSLPAAVGDVARPDHESSPSYGPAGAFSAGRA